MLVETIIGTLTDRLKSEVERRGGRLYTADIERITEELDRKRAQLEAVFRKSFETYVQARERAAFDHARQYPFHRLIVNTFAELFALKRAEADGKDRVTRKVLPGFFMALDRMLPPERLEEYQERCRAIVSRIAGDDENTFDWRSLYGDEEANILLIDALAALAPYFEAFEKRRNWFLPLVNDNLQKDENDTWELSPRGFLNLTLAMFTPLRTELRAIDGRARMFERYGAADCQNLQRIVDKLWGPATGL
jgi:citrate lyase gamma subunit